MTIQLVDERAWKTNQITSTYLRCSHVTFKGDLGFIYLFILTSPPPKVCNSYSLVVLKREQNINGETKAKTHIIVSHIHFLEPILILVMGIKVGQIDFQPTLNF